MESRCQHYPALRGLLDSEVNYTVELVRGQQAARRPLSSWATEREVARLDGFRRLSGERFGTASISPRSAASVWREGS